MFRRFFISSLLIWLVAGSAAGTEIFPKKMSFNVSKGIATGSFDLTFSEDLGSGSRYIITLRNFGGFGFTSKQQLWSMIFKKDLALYGHMITENEDTQNPIRSVFLENNCKSAMGQTKTTCFVYKEKGDAIQTEIFTPYRAIDLVSSIVIATHQASKGEGTEVDFNFIFEKKTKQVTLKTLGNEKIDTPLGRLDTVVLSLRLEDTNFELYRFYIARDDRGYFPAKMAFENENDSAEFVAKTVLWH